LQPFERFLPVSAHWFDETISSHHARSRVWEENLDHHKNMKTLIALYTAAACLVGTALAEPAKPATNMPGPKPAASIEAQLIALETSTWEAVKRHDVKAFADVCLPDCIEIWGDGTVFTIKEVLDQVPDTVLSEYKLEDFKISFPAENTALVRYRVWARAAYKGEATPPRWMLASAVWVKKNGSWKAALYQETPEPTPKPADTASVEKELIQLENEWAKAYVARDLKTLDRLEADDWACTLADGKVVTKAQEHVEVSSGDYSATEFVMSDLKVRVHGDTAVVTGRQKEMATQGGKDASAIFQITDTWIRRDGKWRCIATHLSKIAPAPVVPPKGASTGVQIE
jgi:ketosteroid isomerase-like protein